MSRLVKMIKEYAMTKGKADLCKAADNKSERQLLNYMNGTSNIPAPIGYKLARQCGATHEEAIVLANEASEAKTA